MDNVASSTEPSGERFVPESMGGGLLEAEHQVRYRMALPFVRAKRVLDAGCGVGWGSGLMVDAGASEVVGADIDADAIADATTRVPAASFLTGDLMDLPFDADSFDVVVCFEALEHTSDVEKTLDELARVLRPDGLLFVSSPNPDVYPAGNPFHLNELLPEHLHAACRDRFPFVEMFRQHILISSLLIPQGDDEPGLQELGPVTHSIRPLSPGHDPYSVAVASRTLIPAIPAVQALAPSTQLDELGKLATALTEEREGIREEVRRLSEEREELLASCVRLQGERDAALRDHDRLAVSLVGSEQDGARLQGELEVLRAAVETRDQHIDAMRRSRSWRLTEPLRQVGARSRARPPFVRFGR